jgi:hypothetical protein
MAERVFRILTKLSKNLTDCADKSFAGTVREKIHQAACIRLPPDVPVVSLWIEKNRNLKEAETPDNGAGYALSFSRDRNRKSSRCRNRFSGACYLGIAQSAERLRG